MASRCFLWGMWEDKEQSQRNCRVTLSAKTTKMCQVCPGIEPGRSGASLVISPSFWRLLTTSKTVQNFFQFQQFQETRYTAEMIDACFARAQCLQLQVERRIVMNESTMNQRWIDDELRTSPTLTDVQSFDCDVIHLHLAFSFPWRVPFFCKFFKGLRKRYLTWLVRVALCPSVLICKIRMIRAFIGACQCGRSDCCDLVLRWSRVSHWDLFSVTWNFIFLTVTQLQREVVQKKYWSCKEM